MTTQDETHSAMSLEDALKSLDPNTDDHWTAGGLPQIDHLKGLTDTDVTRADVDEFTNGAKREGWDDWRREQWPDAAPYAEGEAEPAPAPTKEEKVADDVQRAEQARNVSSAPPAQPPVANVVEQYSGVDQGADVIVTWPGDQTFDGSKTAVGKVVGGSADLPNIKVFAPNGGHDMTLTGVKHESKWKESAVDSPDRNLPYWQSLPARSAT